MPKVNLVPREEKEREYRRHFYIVPVAGSIVLLAVLGGSYYYYNNQQQSADDQLQQIKSSNVSLQKQVGELDRYQEIKNKKQTQLNLVSTFYNQRVAWSQILDDLTFVIPSEVWLTAIKGKVSGTQATQSKSTAADTQPDFEIEGYTREMPAVATLMVRLGLIPGITGVTLETAEKQEIQNQLVVHFKISASLKQTSETKQAAVAPNTGESGPSGLTQTTGTSTSPTTSTSPATGTGTSTTGINR